MSHHEKPTHSVKGITFMEERQKVTDENLDFIKNFRVLRLVTILKKFLTFLAEQRSHIFLHMFL